MTAETMQIMRCGSLSLDVQTRRLSGPRGGVRLDNMTFIMAERLMRRPGVIVRDTDLVSAIWPNPDSEPDIPENTIKYKASTLRSLFVALGAGGRSKVQLKKEPLVGYFVEVRRGS